MNEDISFPVGFQGLVYALTFYSASSYLFKSEQIYTLYDLFRYQNTPFKVAPICLLFLPFFIVWIFKLLLRSASESRFSFKMYLFSCLIVL